jgi:threonine synthase
MRESGGWAAAVSDAELVDGIHLLAREAGIFTETAGGVTVAAALKLARGGRFTADDEVVLCITGNGLKTVEALEGTLPEAPLIAPRLKEVVALVEQSHSTARH